MEKSEYNNNQNLNNSNNFLNTVESMLKELKSNLNKFESLLLKIERSEIFITHNIKKIPFKVDDVNVIKPYLDEIEKIKNEIDKNIKNISTVIVKQEHKFMLNKYKELKEQLNQRNKNLLKNINKLIDNKRIEEMISNKNTLNSTKGVEILNEENQSLNTCLKISEDLKKMGQNAEEELELQGNTLNKNLEKINLIINKIPGVNKIMKSIEFHKYKEKIILGLVIGSVLFLGLYLTYY